MSQRITQFQVDAFTRKLFGGNPAAVCPLSEWLDDRLLQAIAQENNLSETAFFVPTARGFHLRWFTPTTEVEICGHATLASAHVLFEHLGYSGERVLFETLSGALTVERRGKQLAMDFPSRPPVPCSVPEGLIEALGSAPIEVLAADDYFVAFESEEAIRALAPDLSKLKALDRRGVVVTAPGHEFDFVSRFFAPKFGVAEDPVTGSTHCELIPYWALKLGKEQLHAHQASKRGGELSCQLRSDRVVIAGEAVTFMEGEIRVGG